MPHAGEDHGDSEAICGRDHFCVANGATGLDDGGRPGFDDGLEAVGKRKKGVGSGDTAGQGENGFHGSEAGGVNAAHLTGSDADSLAVASIDDGVGLDVFADAPGEEQAGHFLGGWRAAGDDFEVGFGDAASVGVLQKHAARDLLGHWPDGRRMDLDEAEVLFRGEDGNRFLGEGGRGDGFDE